MILEIGDLAAERSGRPVARRVRRREVLSPGEAVADLGGVNRSGGGQLAGRSPR